MATIKTSLAETVCHNLREAILEHRWRRTLPGIRDLCEELQVSRQTMGDALRLLEAEGFVLPSSPGKPREINSEMPDPDKLVVAKGAGAVIVIIAWQRETRLSQTDEEVCCHLRKSLEAMAYTHRYVVFHDISRSRGAKRIGEIIERNPADAYIVIGAHPHCSRKLEDMDVRVVFLGGGQTKGNHPRISYSFTEMCRSALEHLVSVGHRKVSVMLPEVLNNRTKTASFAEERLASVFHSQQLPFSTFNCPRWGKTRADFQVALGNLFNLTPPTALILGDVSHVPRVVSFLMKRGLKCPDDVSLMVLDEAAELQEYDPPISYMKKPNAKLVKATLNAVRKLLTVKAEQKEELTIVPSQLVVTGSVARIAV